MNDWQVIMTDTAKCDLREIALGINEISGSLDTAIGFVMELSSLPETGSIPKDYVLKALGYRYLVHKHYLVFYTIDSSEHKVYIHAFFNEKLDYFRFMRKRI